MNETFDAREFQERLQRLEALLRDLERSADPAAASRTRELVQAVLELHGAGIERMLALMSEAGGAGDVILDGCARDDIVGGLLLLHGLHPLGLDDRVLLALDQVRPYLASHGGNVELLGIEGGLVRLKLLGSCHGCPSSAMTMKQTIEEAILAKAPDVTGVCVEGAAVDRTTTPDGRQLVMLQAAL
jgi:Fe-S cluster biogenesis protein NfuA